MRQHCVSSPWRKSRHSFHWLGKPQVWLGCSSTIYFFPVPSPLDSIQLVRVFFIPKVCCREFRGEIQGCWLLSSLLAKIKLSPICPCHSASDQIFSGLLCLFFDFMLEKDFCHFALAFDRVCRKWNVVEPNGTNISIFCIKVCTLEHRARQFRHLKDGKFGQTLNNMVVEIGWTAFLRVFRHA